MSNGRQSSYTGPSALSLTDIKSYCELMEIDDLEEREELIQYLQKMDAAWLSYFHKKTSKTKGRVTP